jgi:phosphatidate cytidylyltransferase
MAFNLAVFKTRTLTAIVFVLVMLTGLLWNHWSFFILFSIIHFGCWIEYQKLVALIDPGYKNISVVHKYGVMIAGWTLMWYFTNGAFRVYGFKLYSIGWWWPFIFIALVPLIDWLFTKKTQPKNIAHSVLGLIYISLAWGLMMNLRCVGMLRKGSDYYVDFFAYTLPCTLIFSIWINDTMAYIVGSFIGKTPFSKISPKKTWEGTLGGALLAVLVVGLIAWALGLEYIHAAVIALIAAITGTAGDLFESKLKRLAGVKDSGTFMPGHGGFLDRFDSLLIATPFVWLYVVLFVQ